MADNVPLVGNLPQITEVVIDLGIGILIILLFSPFIYAVNLFVADNLCDYNNLVMIFPETWRFFLDIDIGSGFLGLFFAYVLGIASRSVLFFVMPLFKSVSKSVFRSRWIWIEDKIVGFIYKFILESHYGKLNFSKDDIKEDVIDKGFAWQIGDYKYACFRSELARSGSYLNKHKLYWDHESFQCFLFERLYSLFLTFFICYSVYGLILICLSSPFKVEPFISWVLGLIVLSIIILSLFNEMVFHRIAFARIDDVLFELFKIKEKGNIWSKYNEAIEEVEKEKRFDEE
ncbi:MAG: hypothetical protein A7316_06450 [Candidatus Altiarchaeales archaeon WOR_SM1_86-2]|nr:MAG: hypothetical protein A7316_06450 [Candidatus Altiarchaeales archaeon WOR_SM1_86-2]ODS39621.1 MAG: hypothetical protein A7315_10770 [Candidatus Altiarchaeales archaeon WOR_SM1_79]